MTSKFSLHVIVRFGVLQEKTYFVMLISLEIKPKRKSNYFSTVEKILRSERGFAERWICRLYSFLLGYQPVRNSHKYVT